MGESLSIMINKAMHSNALSGIKLASSSPVISHLLFADDSIFFAKANDNECQALNWIKDRVMNKLEGWKENLLSQAGKEVLIKSVIQSIPNYAMSILKLPITFCDQLCARVAKFWWSNNGKSRGIHWVRWDKLSQKKLARRGRQGSSRNVEEETSRS